MTNTIKKIMVVEDEELLLQAITSKLTIHGYETISCSAGKQALEYLNEGKSLPDAIWLDYYLKDMNGLEFAQELKKNTLWEKIPILVVSNSATPDKVKSMLALGVSKYILKAEYKLQDIIATMDQMIAEHEKESQ